ncbi:MAG: alginate lyase family protein, partial [Pseudomonadota bacterium]|nr:alginate lyase family protein [Pseudomonadota bacterium]
GQAGVAVLERRGWLDAADPAPSAAPRQPGVLGAPPLAAGEAAALLREADRICAGQVTLFAGLRADVGARPQWQRDPATGIVGPATFSGAIDITDRALVGDIKHVWELNRHLHLVRLAQAASVSADARYLQTLAAQLRDWLDQCPPRRGPNWTSALELGIRLLNWSLLWQLLGGDASALFAGAAGQRLRRDWLRSIHAHCRHIARHLSRHSSANNHLIGELAGLFVGAATWPCWAASPGWQARAAAGLERQLGLQYSRDGVNREQAFAYHVFSAEFLFAAGLAGQAWGLPFSPRYWQRLRRAVRFLRSVRDVGGHVPMVGDGDDGIAFRLGPDGTDRAAQLLALAGAVFDGAPAPCAGARWLLHALPGARPPACGEAGPQRGWAFPDGGYLLFGARFGQPREILGMLDCGPLGYLGIAAHGHADALAVTLSIGGEPCLVDPGTYSYWQQPRWRDYFRGTAAHNTVRVDGLDQSVSGGRFMWLRHAGARIERMPQAPGAFDFCGSHDGYLRLPDPVRHRRSVRFDAAGATLLVRDELAARKAHRLEQFWHFAPGLVAELDGAGLRVRGRAFSLQLQVSGAQLQLELLHGADDPPLGWYSPAYEAKQPCHVLKITTMACAGAVECRFTIMFS